jgi:hypothetical protein
LVVVTSIQQSKDDVADDHNDDVDNDEVIRQRTEADQVLVNTPLADLEPEASGTLRPSRTVT